MSSTAASSTKSSTKSSKLKAVQVFSSASSDSVGSMDEQDRYYSTYKGRHTSQKQNMYVLKEEMMAPSSGLQMSVSSTGIHRHPLSPPVRLRDRYMQVLSHIISTGFVLVLPGISSNIFQTILDFHTDSIQLFMWHVQLCTTSSLIAIQKLTR